jgi:hypothetical protein
VIGTGPHAPNEPPEQNERLTAASAECHQSRFVKQSDCEIWAIFASANEETRRRGQREAGMALYEWLLVGLGVVVFGLVLVVVLALLVTDDETMRWPP